MPEEKHNTNSTLVAAQGSGHPVVDLLSVETDFLQALRALVFGAVHCRR
jgi:hypothetical protein